MANSKADGWKRLLPPPVRNGLRSAKIRVIIASRLVREFEAASDGGLRKSLRVSRVLFRAAPHSLISTRWLAALYRLALSMDQENVCGDFVECGVYNGGSAAVLGEVLRRSPRERHLWLFDSFAGLPKPTAIDGLRSIALEGCMVGDERRVRNLLLAKCGVPGTRVHIRRGWFHETFPTAHIPAIALLHIDADWYESVKICLERFYDRLQPGAIVVLDDYPHWPGCEQALKDFAAERHLPLEISGGGDDMPAHFRTPR